MDKDIALKLMKIATDTDHLIGQMFTEIDKISNVEQRRKFNDAVANLMGLIARDVIFPIEKEYPDLNPDSES